MQPLLRSSAAAVRQEQPSAGGMDDQAVHSLRRPSLAASVRSSAAIAESLEDTQQRDAAPAAPPEAPPGPGEPSFRPQRQPAPVPHQVNMDVPSSDDDDEGPSQHPRGVSGFLAQRALSVSARSNASMWSSPGRGSGAEAPDIRYRVTLGQLANSSYFHLHEEPPPLLWTPRDAPAAADAGKESPLFKLRDTVRKLLAVANLEARIRIGAGSCRVGAHVCVPCGHTYFVCTIRVSSTHTAMPFPLPHPPTHTHIP